MERISGLKNLTERQQDVFSETLTKTNYCMYLEMGYGKTRLSVVSLDEVISEDEQILIVAQSKTHIGNWIKEIEEVFEGTRTVSVYHSDYEKKINLVTGFDSRFVITTPEVIRSHFSKDPNLLKWLCTEQIRYTGNLQHKVINFSRDPDPFDTISPIFNRMWAGLIIDEFHNLSKITTIQCKALLCIPAQRKVLLSGTIFCNPAPEFFLSYYTILNVDNEFPRNVADTKKYLGIKKKGKGRKVIEDINGDIHPPERQQPDLIDEIGQYQGFMDTVVFRKGVDYQIESEYHEIIVPLSKEEETIYLALKTITLEIAKSLNDAEVGDKRKFSSELLAMVSLLRQSIVCPFLPVASMAIDICSYGEQDEIPIRFFNIINEMNLNDYFDDVENLISTRIQKCLELAYDHDKVIVFCTSRKIIDLIISILDDREIFTLDSNMSPKDRNKTIEKMNNSDNFIMFLTYQIGSTGLNLQNANTVIIFDSEWLSSTMNQAIARIIRQGQNQKVNVYILISNTGIEDAIYKKHINKAAIKDELATGKAKTATDSFTVAEIMVLLQQDVVSEKMRSIFIN